MKITTTEPFAGNRWGANNACCLLAQGAPDGKKATCPPQLRQFPSASMRDAVTLYLLIT
jgi:hypothetical protein